MDRPLRIYTCSGIGGSHWVGCACLTSVMYILWWSHSLSSHCKLAVDHCPTALIRTLRWKSKKDAAELTYECSRTRGYGKVMIIILGTLRRWILAPCMQVARLVWLKVSGQQEVPPTQDLNFIPFLVGHSSTSLGVQHACSVQQIHCSTE